MKKITFIGLGVMGSPMAGHLSKQGYEVTVYNRSEEKSKLWTNQNIGTYATSIKEAVKGSDIVFSCVGNDADLELPSGKAAETYDFEGEIVAVIGKSGRFISKDDALKHIIGYSIMNEGSVRGWMKHSVHAGKNFHASGSWGPWITTVDEIDDFSSLKLETHVNGKLMQSALAGEMIFSLSELIAYFSNLLPIIPGDIIATGSPDGTGGSRNPTAFLNSGDCVEVSVDRIGTLKNYVGP